MLARDLRDRHRPARPEAAGVHVGTEAFPLGRAV
jgi:hypothetical protein